ncbi:efflux RND transporter permease subunit [Microbulbifer agarilyticus]|nr:efflux RND transporter permease subunit [Microbulbifer agarilyticus]
MFVRKPVLAIVVSLVISVAGLLAAGKIPVMQFPQVESSSLQITTDYPGVSAEVVQGFITEPIERVAMTVPGVDYVDSMTTPGRSTVTAWLNMNEDSTDALAELSSRLSQIAYELPSGAQDPAVNVKRADREGGLFYLTVSSDVFSRAALSDYLERRVTPLLSSVEGVQKVELSGGRTPAMRVWLDPLKMASLNVGAADVQAALRDNNVVASLGRADNASQDISILSNATLSSPEDFRRLVVMERDNSTIRLGDIARVALGEDRGTENARIDQQQTVFIAIFPAPGANEISIGDEVYSRLDKIEQILPDHMDIQIGYDGTIYMRDALKEIFTTLAETIVLVGIVVLLLMGSFRTAVVPLVTIPISILGSIAAMSLLGFSVNLLTVLAIVLSVGLVVDDAIVVVENVARHMREGKTRLEAALQSSRELLRPIAAMTLTLAVVYAPIAMVSGLSGALFREFAFTLAIAVLFSGVVAVTLSPVMSAFVSPEKGKEGRFTQKVNGVFEQLATTYGKVLHWSFHYRGQILASAVVLSLLAAPFYLFSSKELAPVEDQSSMYLISEAPASASLVYSNDYMRDAVNHIYDGEGVDMVWQVVSAGNGFSGIEFVPTSERDKSVHELLPEVYASLQQITGLRVLPILPPALPTAGQFDVELVIQSQDSYENMAAYAGQLMGAAYGTGKFMFVDTDLKLDAPVARLQLDHAAIADLGMTTATVSDQISAMVAEQEINRFDGNGKAYRVIPRIEASARQTTEDLLDLYIQTPSGEQVQLSTIATVSREVGPRIMGKFDRQRSFRILGGVIPGFTNEDALSALEAVAKDILPADYQINHAGISRQLRKEGNSLVGVLGVALFVVYLVLTVQFNSFRTPLVVLLGSVPLALSGSMVFTFLGLSSMNIYAQIGFITLVGLIAKNGILITEFASELQRRGKEKVDAIVQAAQTRLRPILMTTAATVLGHFPLVLVTGPGAEARNSIGIILVAGMMIGTLFTLLVLPTVYMLIARDTDQKESSETTGVAINAGEVMA